MYCTVSHASSLNIHQLASALGAAKPDHILFAAGASIFAMPAVPDAAAILSRKPLTDRADVLVTRGLRRSLEAFGATDLTPYLMLAGRGGAQTKPVAGHDAATTAQHVINMQKIVTSAQELLPLLKGTKASGKAAVQLAMHAWRAGLSGPKALSCMKSAALALASGTETTVDRAWQSALPVAPEGKHSGKPANTAESTADSVAMNVARKLAEHKGHDLARAMIDPPASSSTSASSSLESKSSERHDDVAERIAALGVAGQALTDNEPEEGRRERWAPFLRLASGFTASQMGCDSEAARLEAFITATKSIRQSVSPAWAGYDEALKTLVLREVAAHHAQAFFQKRSGDADSDKLEALVPDAGSGAKSQQRAIPVEVTLDVTLKGERWAFTDQGGIRISGAPQQRGYDFAQVLWNLVAALTHHRHASLVRDAQAGSIGQADSQLARLVDILVASRSGVVNKRHLQDHVGYSSVGAGKLALLLPSWVLGASDADKVLAAQVAPSMQMWAQLNPPRLDSGLRQLAEKQLALEMAEKQAAGE